MDTVGDFLTRIRNAGMAKHESLDIVSSKLREGIAQVLHQSGYIRGFKVAKDKTRQLMRVYLRYNESGDHMICKVKRVSKPGCRVYVKQDNIPEVRSGYGIVVMSTNKGVMNGKIAKEKAVGGEVLCQVW
ncbi:MAG: 30S ribosomal protein S8 [Bdellovibrionaceae bacterium]|nr:30S ribosomal protein S8 [Pseudobdellovibrionaceae bacterium]